jgi:predicted secreted Zn-dependent protease
MPGGCGLLEILYYIEGAGRPVDSTGENGYMIFPQSLVYEEYRDNLYECPIENKVARQRNLQETKTIEYEVMGDDLTEVDKDIFDAQTGKGPRETKPDGTPGERFAGVAELKVLPTYVASYDAKKKEVTIHTIDVTWVTEITLPKWTPGPNVPQAQKDEWTRFVAALTVHENGHKDINDQGMAKVKQNLVNKMIVLPNINAPPVKGDANYEQMKAAVQNLIKSDPDYMKIANDNIAYDATNNHGETQGATLNVNNP